jgi:hypothetical protein
MRRSAILVMLSLLALPAPARSAVTPEEEARILGVIRDRLERFRQRYRGVVYTRKGTVKEFDGKGGLEKTRIAEQEVREEPGKPPVVTIRSCLVDGKPAGPEECKGKREPKAMLPIFEAEGRKHYRTPIVGEAMVGRTACYKVRIDPLQRTEQHFAGHMFFAKDSLQPVQLEGSIASFPTGLKSFYLKINFRQKGEYSVAVAAYMDLWVHVPLIKRGRIVTTSTGWGHRFLPR